MAATIGTQAFAAIKSNVRERVSRTPKKVRWTFFPANRPRRELCSAEIEPGFAEAAVRYKTKEMLILSISLFYKRA